MACRSEIGKCCLRYKSCFAEKPSLLPTHHLPSTPKLRSWRFCVRTRFLVVRHIACSRHGQHYSCRLPCRLRRDDILGKQPMCIMWMHVCDTVVCLLLLEDSCSFAAVYCCIFNFVIQSFTCDVFAACLEFSYFIQLFPVLLYLRACLSIRFIRRGDGVLLSGYALISIHSLIYSFNCRGIDISFVSHLKMTDAYTYVKYRHIYI